MEKESSEVMSGPIRSLHNGEVIQEEEDLKAMAGNLDAKAGNTWTKGAGILSCFYPDFCPRDDV